MSTNITDRAAQVLREIDAALALAEKSTQGPWETGAASYQIYANGKHIAEMQSHTGEHSNTPTQNP